MEDYQREYIENCKNYRDLVGTPFQAGDDFDACFETFIESMRRSEALASRNTKLIRVYLLPVLDDLYRQNTETLKDLEDFANELSDPPSTLDLALSEQIHSALLSAARRSGRRDDIIRELYNLGMVRYKIWNMFTGLPIPSLDGFRLRMMYCFAEAASFLKYFDEFGEETCGYILRSFANQYLGIVDDWREKLACVRRSMQVFTDKHYREAAPNLPWDKYMEQLHQQMITVLPHNDEEGTISPDAVVDVMESAHLIYELQYERARQNGEPLLPQRLMPYFAVEYNCGLISREDLLAHMEEMMDSACPTAYDSSSNYQILSMAAFYSQYLRRMPEQLKQRTQYLNHIYRRSLRYVMAAPADKATDQMKLYMRQIMSTFLELPGGVTYEELALTMLLRFAPELYAHGYVVGRMAQALTGVILSGEPGFFDEIPEFQQLPPGKDGDARRDELILNTGILHDIGKLSFTSLYHHSGRKMLRIEDSALRMHPDAGWIRMKGYESTRLYADAARGHHRWYDGSSGYPESYHRKDSPYRSLVDVIAFADYLDSDREDDPALPTRTVPFEEKIEAGIELSGRQFSPLVTGWLHSSELLGELRELYYNGRRDGFAECSRSFIARSRADYIGSDSLF